MKVISASLLVLLLIAGSSCDEKSVQSEIHDRTDIEHPINHESGSNGLHSKEEKKIEVLRSYNGIPQEEGAGARVFRTIGTQQIRNLDPFLMLDEFFVSPPAGFPDHPHRGFETVTYMLDGKFQHKDNRGHSGIIGPGDVQWMTAGRGIIHSEMPATNDVNHGLQLWVNLKAADKMIDAKYQELLKKDIPHITKDGVTVRVIAGQSHGLHSQVYTRTPTLYFHVTMEKGSKYIDTIPKNFQTFLYIIEGEIAVGLKETIGIAKQVLGSCLYHAVSECLVLETGDSLLEVISIKESNFVVIGGLPIGEPIAQRGTQCKYETHMEGPFVMNTNEEIKQAINDYQNGKFNY